MSDDSRKGRTYSAVDKICERVFLGFVKIRRLDNESMNRMVFCALVVELINLALRQSKCLSALGA